MLKAMSDPHGTAYAIGIDLGGTNIKAALVNRTRGLVRSTCIETGSENGPDFVMRQIATAAREMMEHVLPHQLRGIGIGAPGTINWDRTTLAHPPNIPGWESIDLGLALQQLLRKKIRVIVENDANAAALGSARFGAGKPYKSFIMVTLGTGVGGAIIHNGRIFRGTTGAAGELGHMSIHYDGPKDGAGVSGAIEAYVGQHYLSRRAERCLASRSDSLLSGKTSLSPAAVAEAALKGDKAAQGLLAWAGHKLGCVLGSCVNLLDIRVFVIGGGVSAAGDLILEPARRTILDYIKPGMQAGVKVVQETRGNEVGTLGAASLLFNDLTDKHAAVPVG